MLSVRGRNTPIFWGTPRDFFSLIFSLSNDWAFTQNLNFTFVEQTVNQTIFTPSKICYARTRHWFSCMWKTGKLSPPSLLLDCQRCSFFFSARAPFSSSSDGKKCDFPTTVLAFRVYCRLLSTSVPSSISILVPCQFRRLGRSRENPTHSVRVAGSRHSSPSGICHWETRNSASRILGRLNLPWKEFLNYNKR